MVVVFGLVVVVVVVVDVDVVIVDVVVVAFSSISIYSKVTVWYIYSIFVNEGWQK